MTSRELYCEVSDCFCYLWNWKVWVVLLFWLKKKANYKLTSYCYLGCCLWLNLISAVTTKWCPCLVPQGARVWLRDKEFVWVPAHVTKGFNGENLTVQGEEDASVSTIWPIVHSLMYWCLQEIIFDIHKQDDLPPLRNPDILVGENDLTTLSYLHEPAGWMFVHEYA